MLVAKEQFPYSIIFKETASNITCCLFKKDVKNYKLKMKLLTGAKIFTQLSGVKFVYVLGSE